MVAGILLSLLTGQHNKYSQQEKPALRFSFTEDDEAVEKSVDNFLMYKVERGALSNIFSRG